MRVWLVWGGFVSWDQSCKALFYKAFAVLFCLETSQIVILKEIGVAKPWEKWRELEIIDGRKQRNLIKS